MTSLLFGLIAALSWGLHDFLVRNLSQKATIAPLLFIALLSGSALLAPMTMIEGWETMTPAAVGLALAAGGGFTLGSVGLYNAFSIGPVRLVAPICGAYPVGSLLLALAQGRGAGSGAWLAVLAIVVGIALVARQEGGEGAPGTRDSRQPDHRQAAMIWAALGAAGFALTFGLGQMAARAGGEMPATLVARLAALLLVALWLVSRGEGLAPALPHWRWLTVMGALDVTALGLVIAAGSRAHPEYAAITSSIFGIVTILLAWVALGERLRPMQWLGVLVVFAGIGTLTAG